MEKRIGKLDKLLGNLDQRLALIFNIRLGLGLLFLTGLVVLSRGYLSQVVTFLLVGLLFVFSFFVFYSRNLKRHKNDLQSLRGFYSRQKQRQMGQPLGGDFGSGFQASLSRDLDLLGPYSLMSMIDETFTSQGQRNLAKSMLDPFRSSKKIKSRQQEVLSLAKISGVLRRVVIEGQKSDEQFRSSDSSLHKLFSEPFLDFSSIGLKIKSVFLAYFVFVVVGLASLVWLPLVPYARMLWTLYLLVFVFNMGAVNGVYSRLEFFSIQLEVLVKVLKRLERLCQNSKYSAFLPSIAGGSTSRIFKNLNRLTSFLSVQANPLVYFVANALFPWTFTVAIMSEVYRQRRCQQLFGSLNDLHKWEIVSSLAFVYRYQTQTFPQVGEEVQLEAQGIFHPLIERDKAVSNDFSFGSKKMALVTGSNMSGKSTFIRTIGINQILSLMGAPVYAKALKTGLLMPATCIRVEDSLRDGFSYFYAETLRIVDIIRRAQEGNPVLYLVDELFKGTNNRERYEGSRATVISLAQTKSIGFITTHDLELTEMEKSVKELGNWHFRENIENGGMTFGYKIHPGPCQTTNAVKIMQSVGLNV